MKSVGRFHQNIENYKPEQYCIFAFRNMSAISATAERGSAHFCNIHRFNLAFADKVSGKLC